MEWISVKKQLPEVGRHCLIFLRDNIVHEAYYRNEYSEVMDAFGQSDKKWIQYWDVRITKDCNVKIFFSVPFYAQEDESKPGLLTINNVLYWTPFNIPDDYEMKGPNQFDSKSFAREHFGKK